ncbi:MAG: hypothetical protein ABI772_10945 [Bacteroidota bacterium]
MKQVLVILSIFILSSCNDDRKETTFLSKIKSVFISSDNRPVNGTELQKYVVNMDHGLLKSKTIDEVTYSIKYKPVDYVIALETGGKKINAAEYKRRREELDGMQYFDLRIEIDKANGELLKYALSSGAEYEERIKYLAFKVNQDIQLIDGKDTLECVMHHFERVYDIVPFATILLGFKNTGADLMHEKTIVFHDKLFGKGIIKFTFLPADLQTIPQLEVIS